MCKMEKALATHSSTLAWRLPWTEEPGRLQSMGSKRVGHNWATSLSLSTFMHWRRKWQPTPVFLPGESQGWRSLMGCHLLLQGIFPTQGSNSCLLHCRRILYCWATREALLSKQFLLTFSQPECGLCFLWDTDWYMVALAWGLHSSWALTALRTGA